MLRVGLTGGIGSGKSTVTRLFESLGVAIIDADQIAREVVTPGQPALQEIVLCFGKEMLTAEGALDRRRLRDKVFADSGALDALEAMLHPRIRSEMRRRAAAASGKYCILAIPLLLEKHWEDDVDRILVIDAPPELQIARVQARDGVTRAEAEKILATQWTREQRLAKADDVITNNGDLARLQEQVTMAHQRYLALAETLD